MKPALSRDEVAHVAKLARLRLDEDTLTRMGDELGAVLDHLAKLRAVDVENVEPLAHPLELTNRLAEDRISEPMAIEQLLANAPAAEGRFLAVPKVL